MAIQIKEFVIQAKFEKGEDAKNEKKKKAQPDAASMKEDIISDCMEKLEEYLRKREGR